MIEFKKYVAGDNIFYIIIDKFCYKKKLYLIILFKIDKNLKISFYYIILSLSFYIYL